MAVGATGFSGGSVVLADVATKWVLPVCAPGRGWCQVLAWTADGS